MAFPSAIIPDGAVRPVYNGTGSTIAANLLVKFSSAGDPIRVALPGAADDAIYGVTLAAIANGHVGDVQTFGRAIVTVGAGGVTATNRLMPATTGKVVALSAGGGTNVSLVGQAEVTAAEDDLISIELPGPFASRQG